MSGEGLLLSLGLNGGLLGKVFCFDRKGEQLGMSFWDVQQCQREECYCHLGWNEGFWESLVEILHFFSAVSSG